MFRPLAIKITYLNGRLFSFFIDKRAAAFYYVVHVYYKSRSGFRLEYLNCEFYYLGESYSGCE